MNESQTITTPATSLEGQERPTIGMLMRGILNPVDQARWTGICDVAREEDVNLISFAGGILYSPYRFEAQRNVLYELVSARHVDGLVIWSGTLEWFIGDEIEAFCRRYHPLPVVSLDRAFKGIPSVVWDDSQGVREAVAHLIEVHGYRRIACIRSQEGQLEAEVRYRGYIETLAEHGLPFDPNLVSPPCKHWSSEDGVEMIGLLLDKRGLRPKVDFEAVVAANDEIAFGVMNVLRARGIRIPDEVAVIGFDDRAEAMGTTPPLTTVKSSFYKQGRQAAELLLACLRGEHVPELVSMTTELVLRESCGCLQSALVQSETGRAGHTTAAETLDAALAVRRSAILSGMVKAVEDSSAGIVPGWEAQLLDAFVVELEENPRCAFLSALDDILHRVMDAEGEVGTWHGVVSALRLGMLPYLSETKMLSLAENLWHQAQVLIGERSAQAHARQALRTEQQALMLRMVSQTLITTFDTERVIDVLAESLQALHIPSCYLALYERPEPYEYPQLAPERSRLILAYKDGERIELSPDKQRLPTRNLIPEGLLPRGRRYDMVIEPLYFREHQLGFALLEVGPRDGTIYEAIRAQLSSALQGAQLVHQVENRALQLRTAAEVSRAASSILDPDKLIQQIVDLVCGRFKLYFAGLFLVDQSGEWSGEPARWAVLRAGTGEAGRKMFEAGYKLEVDGTSRIGRCITHNEARIALDVGEEAVQFSNPLLPLTRSEIVLPLNSRGRVIGAMTVRSTQEAAFSAEDLTTLQTMADQVANAIENARLFAERKRAEEVLARERKLAEEGFHTFKYIVENSIDAMLMTDAELRVVYANQAFNQLIAHNATGQSLKSLWFEDDLPLLNGSLEQARMSSPFSAARLNGFHEGLSGSWHGENRLQRSDGSVIHVDSITFPAHNKAGQFIGLVASFRDATERKRTEEEIRRLNAELEQRVKQRTAELEVVNKELQSFAYVVSHDLKAPLRGIGRLTQWLIADYTTAFDAKGKEMADLLVGRVKRMDALIDGILEYSRVGRIVGQSEAIDLNRLLSEVVDLLSPPPAIQIEIVRELPVIVGDSTRIQQVFSNLIGNAMKFMDKPRGIIRVDCKDGGGAWQFSVTDNGPGIELRHYERIFQIFQTLRPRDEMENTGVGLTIVRKIVELYGGEIWVESEPGKGSSFMFTFPK